MNRKKIIIIILVVIAALTVAAVLYWPEYQKNREAGQFNQQRIADLKQNNPRLLEKLLKGIERDELAVKQTPDNFEAWRDLGVAYQALGGYKKAETAYMKAAELVPINTVVWNNLAELYKQQEKYEEAAKSYLKLIEVVPSEVSAYLSLAELYAAGRAGSVEDAKYILQQGILKTNSGGLKDALERLNKEGKL